MKKQTLVQATSACVLLMCSVGAQANLIVNGDFETGNTSGWTSFITPSGSLGNTGVSFFETSDSITSRAGRFQVGSSNGTLQGGGIFQTVNTGSGFFDFNLDIASSGFSNGSGGLFSVLVDGVVLDTFDFGFINGTERSQLSGVVNLAAGNHEFRILIERAFGGAPSQYVDNVALTASAVPIPAAIWLFGTGLIGLVGMARRERM